jgi:hypothetical protein
MGFREFLRSLFSNPADVVKLGTCFSLAAASLVYCFYVAANHGTNNHIQVLICILGGAIGWCIGMYLTPSSEGETKKFAEFGKIVLLLGAGIGIANASDLLQLLKPVIAGDTPSIASLRLLLFSCSLLIFGQGTYIGRLHVRGADDERQQKRERLISEMRKSLDELSNLR